MSSPPRPTEQLRRIRVDGQNLRISIRPGTEPGPPLLLCNGIGASLELLQPFVDAVDPPITVIRFDVPGVGGSPLPRRPYRFSTLARLLGRILTQLGHDRFDVLGISWGGGLAQQIALQHRRRCRRLILVATGTGALMIPARPRVLAKMITPRRYRDPAYATAIAAELYGGRLRTQPQLARHLLHDHSRVGTRRGYRLQLFAGLGWTSLPLLPLIRQPTLILAGQDDPIIPLANAHILRRLIPDATMRLYDDGHLGLITKADELGPSSRPSSGPDRRPPLIHRCSGDVAAGARHRATLRPAAPDGLAVHGVRARPRGHRTFLIGRTTRASMRAATPALQRGSS